MKRLAAVLIVSILTVGLISVGISAQGASAKGHTYKGSGTLTVSFSPEETKGYEWIAVVGKSTVVQATAGEVYRPTEQEQKAGRRTTFAFELQALRAGVTEVTICYQNTANPRQIKEVHSYQIKVDTKKNITATEQLPTDRIELAGNVTTGYSWYPIGSQDGVNVASYLYLAEQTGRTGSGGVFFFPISGLRAGSWDVSFAYRRPFEEGVSQTKTVRVTVNKDLSIKRIQELK